MEKSEFSLYTPPSTSDVDSSEERSITPPTITSNELPLNVSPIIPPKQLPGDRRKQKNKFSAPFGKKNPIVKTPSPALPRSRSRKLLRPYDSAQSPVRKYIRQSPSRRCMTQPLSSFDSWPEPRKRHPVDFSLESSFHEKRLSAKPPPGLSRRATSGIAAVQPMREISMEALEAARKAIFSEIYSDFEDSSEEEADVDLLLNLSTAYSVRVPDLISHTSREDIAEMPTAPKELPTQGSENADGSGITFEPDEQYEEAESKQPAKQPEMLEPMKASGPHTLQQAIDRTERSKSLPPNDVQIEEKSNPRRSLKRKRGAAYSMSEERNSKYPVQHLQPNLEAQVYQLSRARHLNLNVLEPPPKRIYQRTKVEVAEVTEREILGFSGRNWSCLKIKEKYSPSREFARKAAVKIITVLKDFLDAMIFWWLLTFVLVVADLTDEYQFDRDGMSLTLMEQFERIRYLMQDNISLPALLSFWVIVGRVLKKNFCWLLCVPWLYHSGHFLFINANYLIRDQKEAGSSVGMMKLLFFLLLATLSFNIVIRCLDDISRERGVSP